MAMVSLTDAAMCMTLINESLFKIMISYVIFSHWIFYCANTNAIHMPDWKFSEGGR